MKKNTSIIAAVITALGGITAAFISIIPQADQVIPNILALFNPNTETRQQETAVTFKIHNTLGTNQLSETATISINGELVGKLFVDANNRDSFLAVNVPQAGQQSYSISTVAVFEEAFGRQLERYGAGQGFIHVSNTVDEEIFMLVTAFSGSQPVVSLQKK